MATLEQRIKALETTATRKRGFRPKPLSYFYGEPLPADFYTSDAYLKKLPRTLKDFYGDDTVTKASLG